MLAFHVLPKEPLDISSVMLMTGIPLRRERSHATVQRHEGLFTRTVSVKMSLPTYL